MCSVSSGGSGEELGDGAQVSARNMLVQSFRTSVVKKKKVQVTNRSMKILHRKFTIFEKYLMRKSGDRSWNICWNFFDDYVLVETSSLRMEYLPLQLNI